MDIVAKDLQHDVDEIIASLRHISLGFVYEELNSTNDKAQDIEARYQHSGMAVLAKRQTKGRGRMSRTWLMTEGDIALSLILRPPCLPSNLNLLPLLVGVSCVEALAKLGVKAFLKWPNDIIIAGDENKSVAGYLGHYRKVGGILIENIYQQGRVSASIVGIGLNIMPHKTCLDAYAHAAYLRQCSPHLSWHACLKTFLTQLDAWLDTLNKPDFDVRIMQTYTALCKTLGYTVKVDRTPPIIGVARAINAQGALVVNDGMNDHLITAGDVIRL